MVKKAYFFSLDAFIAATIILTVIVVVPYFYSAKKTSEQPIYFSSDLVQIFSTIKIGSINNSDIQAIINSTNPNILNRTFLEQVLKYKVLGQENKAEELIRLMSEGLLPNNYGFGVWAEGYGSPIYSQGSTQKSQLISSKQMISGIEKSRAIEGMSSRVFLTGINERVSSSYAYFGGYEGDGNITKYVTLPSSINNITSAYLEIDVNGNFALYINGNYSGLYAPQFGNMTADSWNLTNSNLTFFQPETNILEFRFTGANKYIGGGYLKVTYTTPEISMPETNKYEFPGIDGVINLYSSFYVPGTLNSMSIYLHYFSDYEIFLNIGSTTVFDYDIKGENIVTIPNEDLNLSLNYSDLSLKTIPLRLGLRNVSYFQYGFGGTADSVLVTDVSGSMSECAEYNSTPTCDYDCCVGGACPDSYSCQSATCSDEECGSCPSYPQSCMYDCYWLWGVLYSTKSCESSTCVDEECGDCGTWRYDTNHQLFGGQSTAQNHYQWDNVSCIKSKLAAAKEADKEFVDIVLAILENRVGLVSYRTTTSNTHSLSINTTSLYNQINSYNPSGGTCICCGINSAANILATQSNSSRAKSMLVMSDGQANYGCAQQPNSSSIADAVQAACDAYEDYNITVYAVGFGSDADTTTLSRIAKCGRGDYYYTNVSNLTAIYQGIAEKIVNLSYQAQTITSFQDFEVNSTLYPDSYIQFSYTSTYQPDTYGVIPITIETPRFGNSITQGSFNIPNGVVVYDAKLTSYSADKWTDRASIDSGSGWQNFYNLSNFGSDYHILGDPYIVNIPVGYIQSGDNNIQIGTGLTPQNATGGSPDDKAIYTLGINIFINYTSVFEKAEGCIWQIEFEDSTNTSIIIPNSYTGANICQFTSTTDCTSDYNNDAINNAVCQLFDQLDFDGDGKLYVKIGQDDLQTETVSIGGIPYMWGPTIMEVRVWQ